MAKRDPAERLKQFLSALKKKKLRDDRVAHSDPDAHQGDEVWYGRPGINWLVHEWQVWMSLQFYGRHPKTVTSGELEVYSAPLAAPFQVDAETVLYAGQRQSESHGWMLVLVWRVGEDFGFRTLTEAETEKVSALHHEMFRGMLGIRFNRLPPDGIKVSAS